MGPFRTDRTTEAPALTALQAGLVACHLCGKLSPLEQLESHQLTHCPRCRAPLHPRKPRSVQRAWGWLIAGLILYIPANLYPMMVSELLGRASASTIIGGVLELVAHGSYLIAVVVFVASIVVPVMKFLVMIYLLLSIQIGWKRRQMDRLRLFRLVEFVGRWSMVDVFVVALLAALVQMGALANIVPGPAASAFAATVVMTMFSALALDPRLIWD